MEKQKLKFNTPIWFRYAIFHEYEETDFILNHLINHPSPSLEPWSLEPSFRDLIWVIKSGRVTSGGNHF